MVKTGIWRLNQLGRRRSLFGRPRTISLRFLQLSQSPSPSEVALFEELVRDLRLSSGVYRTTCRHRFDAIRDRVNPLMRARFPATAELVVYDWATSDALAACEWAEELCGHYPALRFEASDLCLFALEAAHPRRGCFILEPDGKPLQYICPPMVVSLVEAESAAYPLNRWLAGWAARNAAELRGIIGGIPWQGFPDDGTYAAGAWEVRQIPLVHPEAMAFHRRHSWFRFRIHSVFEAAATPAHVIRTMNILNRGYFDAGRLREGSTAVLHSLLDGGLWIVGNSGDPQAPKYDVSIFRRTGMRFEEAERIGQGSEISEIVLAGA